MLYVDIKKEIDMPYGYCPICGDSIESRERRINGNDTCVNGHIFESSTALFSKPEIKDVESLLRERLSLLESILPDPDKLLILADWLDKMYPNDKNPEIQTDLRKWARDIRHAKIFNLINDSNRV